jgi:riboflavin synthase
MAVTTLGSWQQGDRINLERALCLGDELGGHIVSGHVDGLAVITSITPAGDSHVVWLEAPQALAKFVAPKGSVALDWRVLDGQCGQRQCVQPQYHSA